VSNLPALPDPDDAREIDSPHGPDLSRLDDGYGGYSDFVDEFHFWDNDGSDFVRDFPDPPRRYWPQDDISWVTERVIDDGGDFVRDSPARRRERWITERLIDWADDDDPDPGDAESIEPGSDLEITVIRIMPSGGHMINNGPDEIELRGPTKRVVVIYGRWSLPVVGRKGYTYETDLGLQVGDIVMVPPTAICREPQEATVVRLGSDYSGYVHKITELVARKPMHDQDRAMIHGEPSDHPWYCQCRVCDDEGEGVR
jgi:hypothetical protein